MAMVKLDDSTLHSIADKIREKNKEVASYKPSEMPAAIDRIVVTEPVIQPLAVTANGTYAAPVGVHGYNPITVNVPPTLEDIEITANGEYTSSNADGFGKVTVNTPTLPDEALNITGNCKYKFAYSGWDWFINNYKNRITTSNITNCENMFHTNQTLKEFPAVINIKDCTSLSYMFYNCIGFMTLPKIRGTIKWTNTTSMENMFYFNGLVRDMEDVFTPEMFDGFSQYKVTTKYSVPRAANFNSCSSLRKVPSWWFKCTLNPESSVFPYASYSLYSSTFNACSCLDEVVGIPVWKCAAPQTDNMFNSVARDCYRIKNFTFATNDDGTPIVTEWKGQSIDLSGYVGYSTASYVITSYNSGITADKEVKDDATYQALKNDPDWFTTKVEYSRYNHASAVATINSLPDTSAYLASAGGTNTIRFQDAAGSATDGGAISTLTAEEIAVATAKGWTVTLI